jgi:hypothetical protein
MAERFRSSSGYVPLACAALKVRELRVYGILRSSHNPSPTPVSAPELTVALPFFHTVSFAARVTCGRGLRLFLDLQQTKGVGKLG